MRPGDTLVVWKLDRLARAVKQLIETVEELSARSIGQLAPCLTAQPFGAEPHIWRYRPACAASSVAKPCLLGLAAMSLDNRIVLSSQDSVDCFASPYSAANNYKKPILFTKDRGTVSPWKGYRFTVEGVPFHCL
jgi:hypothetical protein